MANNIDDVLNAGNHFFWFTVALVLIPLVFAVDVGAIWFTAGVCGHSVTCLLAVQITGALNVAYRIVTPLRDVPASLLEAINNELKLLIHKLLVVSIMAIMVSIASVLVR